MLNKKATIIGTQHPTVKLCTVKVMRFRQFDIKGKVRNIGNVAGIVLHKNLCQHAHVHQNLHFGDKSKQNS